MAKRKRRKRKGKKSKFEHGLKEETIRGIFVVVFAAIGIFLILSAISKAGVVGGYVYQGLFKLLGVGYYLLPALALILAGAFLKALQEELFGRTKLVGSIVFFLSGLGFIELVSDERGGLIGGWITSPLIKLFDVYVTGVILVALFLISIFVIFDFHLNPNVLMFWRRLRRDRNGDDVDEDVEVIETGDEENIPEEVYEDEDEEPEEPEPEDDKDEASGILGFGKKRSNRQDTVYLDKEYTPPPIKLLERDRGKPGAGDVKANANIIKRTLLNFGIVVEIEEVTVGPSVTRYAVKPAEGVRLSKILSLQNNLELALAAHPVRIEAPIPGKSLVGIEIPNSAKTTVGLATLLSQETFKKAVKPLFFSLGRGVSGESHFADLGKMPHLLVAGATGAGKSVTMHTLITSLLYRNGPGQMRLILVDPKRVEMTLYNGIPHLLTPVITDAKKTILALKWLINEMDRRYDILESESVRDLTSYHNTIVKPAYAKGSKTEDEMPEPLPYIVVVIDELADIMSTYPRELEASIVRLAQMSRAVGIHLVLSTQRPSVNVITGLIKANIPGRIALQVASQVDSRTILDMSGAEKLLGAGDMLFLSAEMSKPVRIQSGFISEQELKRVVSFLKKQYSDDSLDELDFSGDEINERIENGFDEDDEDDLYEDARETIIEAGKASTSYLQRKLRVGYARAARLMDVLEERGVIGPPDGSKPREVLEVEEEEEE